MFNPATGMFLQRDPFGYEDSVNLYAGLKHDPINNRDPTGTNIVTSKACFPIVGCFETCDGDDCPATLSERAEGWISEKLSSLWSTHAPQVAKDEVDIQSARLRKPGIENARELRSNLVRGAEEASAGEVGGRDHFALSNVEAEELAGNATKIAAVVVATTIVAPAIRINLINKVPKVRATKKAKSTGIKVSKNWKPRDIADPACARGCERVARQIQKHVGGAVHRIKPGIDAPGLGRYRGKNLSWTYHEVVVKDGRVFDAFTGRQGLPISEYKVLWEYPDALDFGF
jgi:hypothetical protein